MWAEWCVSTDTDIYTSPHSSKLASEISEKDSVISFSQGISTDNIIHSRTSNKEGHCKCVSTIAGRTIETTDDHSFFTRRGWVPAKELTENDKVAILPVVNPVRFQGKNEILFDETSFNHLRQDYKNLSKFVLELKRKDFLPLKKNDPKILTLARLTGALFSDGCLYNSKKNNYREISFHLGQKNDVEDVIKDLELLGFNKLHVSEKTSNCEINGRKFTMHNHRVKCLSTSLYLLFRVLGVPEGNKTNQKYNIPAWIMNGEKAVKKEFLAGYLGGDGPKVSIKVVSRIKKNPYNHVGINDIEFRKRTDLAENGIEFAKEISELLGDFGVDIGKIFYEIDPYVRKDKTQTAIIHVGIKHTVLSGYVLSQEIGYAYCWQKQLNSMFVGEFLRGILVKRASWKMLREQALLLNQDGLSFKQISEKLKIAYDSVYSWLKKKSKSTIQKHYLKFDEWLSNSTEGLKDGFVWQKIDKIWDVFLPEVQVLTTKNHHNFVANGFLVHNCGPCRAMAPVFERVSKDFEGKVKFAKLNIDQNRELADEYGVMSIPTLLLFVGGEEKDRLVGAMDDTTLKAKLQELL